MSSSIGSSVSGPLFFFNDTATTEIYPLSLHDALPILTERMPQGGLPLVLLAGDGQEATRWLRGLLESGTSGDRKSTRLNSSHVRISYAVFCLKKKKDKRRHRSHCVYERAVYTCRPHTV